MERSCGLRDSYVQMPAAGKMDPGTATGQTECFIPDNVKEDEASGALCVCVNALCVCLWYVWPAMCICVYVIYTCTLCACAFLEYIFSLAAD